MKFAFATANLKIETLRMRRRFARVLRRRQSNGARSLTHSLTHSILINLFIKLELNNFPLPLLLSMVFVQECSVVLRKVFDEGRLERRTFYSKNGEPGKEFVERIKD